MEMRTYTDLWRMRGRLYTIMDIPLIRPVEYAQIGVAVAVAVIWIPLATAIGLPAAVSAISGMYSSGTVTVLLAGPPVLLALAAGRPLIEGRTIGQQLVALALYVRPARLVRFRVGAPAADHTRIRGYVWRPLDNRRGDV